MAAAVASEAPRVWALEAKRAGDHAQVLGLAERLGLPFVTKRLVRHALELPLAPPFAASRMGLVRGRSDPLEPPWPDLVISGGREAEAVARWIGARTGGRCALVHVGRPWGGARRYDLVVTTPQYRFRPAANIIESPLPFHTVTRERLADAAEAWRPRLGPLADRAIALLVGGPSLPWRFGREEALRLAMEASALARSRDAALLVSTSTRTPALVTATLEAAIDVPFKLYCPTRERGSRDNPFVGFLALAREIIVTGDSVSMAAEAVATAKPVHIFDLGRGAGSMRDALRPPFLDPSDFAQRLGVGTALYRLLQRLGPPSWSRDLGLFQRRLVATGRAVWLGSTSLPPTLDHCPITDFDAIIERVRAIALRAQAARMDERSCAVAASPVAAGPSTHEDRAHQSVRPADACRSTL